MQVVDTLTIEAGTSQRTTEIDHRSDKVEEEDGQQLHVEAHGETEYAEKECPTNEPSHSPNEPHPCLDFPPIYFALKNCFPNLLETIKGVYSLRWSLSYPLQKRVRGSKILRHLGIYLTYGEILLFIPITILALVCLYQTWIVPSLLGTGRMARLSVFASLLFAQKNSYITFLVGIPFDRAVTYHKVSGYVAVITGLLHGLMYLTDSTTNVAKIDGNRIHELVQGPMNTSGTMILLFMLGMYFTSLPIVRRKLFEVFYLVHIVLLVGIIGATAVHTGYMVPLVVTATTGFDYLIRKVAMAQFRYPKNATLKIISDSVVEVSFPKVAGFDYNPGQYGKSSAFFSTMTVQNQQATDFVFLTIDSLLFINSLHCSASIVKLPVASLFLEQCSPPINGNDACPSGRELDGCAAQVGSNEIRNFHPH